MRLVGHIDFVLSGPEGIDQRPQFNILYGKYTRQFIKKISFDFQGKVALMSFHKLYSRRSTACVQHLQVQMTKHRIEKTL